MTKSTQKKLDYMAERQKSPEEVAKRVARNRARREAIRDGRVSKGDGKELDHKKPLDAGGSKSSSNTRVVDAKENRGWRKDKPEMYDKKK
jgi:hypothetical protein